LDSVTAAVLSLGGYALLAIEGQANHQRFTAPLLNQLLHQSKVTLKVASCHCRQGGDREA
jgi:hypothetical protein